MMVNHPGRGNPILAVLRRSPIGRRPRITRAEMARLLQVLQVQRLVEMDNGWGGSRTARAITMRREQDVARAIEAERAKSLAADPFADLPPPSRLAKIEPSAADLAQGWVDCCRGISVISVLAPADDTRYGSNPGDIRYDEPGSMHPQLRATLMFVPASCAVRATTLAYLRERAKRVLIVDDSAD